MDETLQITTQSIKWSMPKAPLNNLIWIPTQILILFFKLANVGTEANATEAQHSKAVNEKWLNRKSLA